MRMLLGAGLFTALVLVVPSGASSVLGTEDFPELPDASGDVEALPAYTGPTDAIDITAAWFSYDATADLVAFTLRTANGGNLDEVPPGHHIGCEVSGNVTFGEKSHGRLVFEWLRPPGAEIRHDVYWVQETTTASFQGTPLEHEFSATLEAPGYYAFGVPRGGLTNFADQVEDPRGTCFAFIDPGLPGVAVSGGANVAADSASSRAVYSFTELRQARTAQGEVLDPVEEFERTHDPGAQDTSNPDPRETPSLVAAVVAATLVAGAILAKRFRRLP